MSADLPNKFVVGFAFIEYYGTYVVLIEKKRPEWQAGKVNGLGGHMREGESTQQAMAWEFHEECGIETRPGQWKETEGNDNLVVLATYLYGPQVFAQSTTDERVRIVPLVEALSLPNDDRLQVPNKIRHAMDVLDGKVSFYALANS